MEGMGRRYLKQVQGIEEKDAAEEPRGSWPVYHLPSPVGWMDDPNGFSVYEGEYHLFFQYCPFSNASEPMHWGHCRSKDFIQWECPDFSSLEEQQPQGYGLYNGNHGKSICSLQREKAGTADYGLDFYTPQTVLLPDGRQIMVGWMQLWDTGSMESLLGWSGMMTIPRELSLRNGRVCQNPVRELEGYRKNLVEYAGERIAGESSVLGISGRVIDLEVEITEFGFHHFAIHFAKNETYEMLLQYNRRRNCLTIDRVHTGLVHDVVCRREMKAQPAVSEGKETLKLRMLLDRYLAEVFVNDGEQAMTSLFLTPMEAEGIVFDTDGEACINIRKYDICV